MSYLKRVDIDNVPTYYLEKIETICIYPYSNKVIITTFREYFNSNDEVIKTEGGQEIELTGNKYNAFINVGNIDLDAINNGIKNNYDSLTGGN